MSEKAADFHVLRYTNPTQNLHGDPYYPLDSNQEPSGYVTAHISQKEKRN